MQERSEQQATTVLQTPRLWLRRFSAADSAAFAAMNADAEVMAHFPALLSPAQSDALLARIAAHWQREGFGLCALECRHSGALLGFCGLLKVAPELPCAPAVEIGWRLVRSAWGQGLAHEAAHAVLGWAFTELALAELVSFTAVSNQRSQRLMQRLGMQRDSGGNFHHPALPAEHALAPHVLYRLTAAQWLPPRCTSG